MPGQQPASSLDRRRFLKHTAAASAALFAAPAVLSARSPSEKLNVVIIGCGGRGAANMNEMLKENIVALCDVSEPNLMRAAERAPKAQKFRDFRKLYDSLKDNDFDAVVVSSTEHTHAFATLPALRRKKHVYCEKPLTHNLREARIIMEAAQQAKVATQMGTQIHAGSNYRRVVELIQRGAIGPVREVHVWVSRAWGWQSEQEAKAHRDLLWTVERPTREMPVPGGLAWNLWLGPAPRRPFSDVYVPGPRWYRWWDFGGGTMSDLGAHWIDLPFWALKLESPRVIEASGPPPHPEIAPASMSATFHFGPRGELPEVKLTWYQGTLKPELWKQNKIPQWGDGALFIGSKGSLLSNYSKFQLLPEEKGADFDNLLKDLPKSPGHHAEWLQACKTGAATSCPFSYSGLLTESNHLGNIAYRVGKRLEWDARTMRIRNVPDAEHYLGREYRQGWKLV